jgi:hypothetical protein
MKYITHSIASTTWVALNRSRIFTSRILILIVAGALAASQRLHSGERLLSGNDIEMRQ